MSSNRKGSNLLTRLAFSAVVRKTEISFLIGDSVGKESVLKGSVLKGSVLKGSVLKGFFFSIFSFFVLRLRPMYNKIPSLATTVNPVYNGHPWDLKKAAVGQRSLIKLRFRLAVDGSNWPLLTGGRCSQVVVKSGLTVFEIVSTKIC
jgi:hypothetical protein